MKKALFLIPLLLWLAGCAGNPEVRPTAASNDDPRLVRAQELETQGKAVEAFKAYQELATPSESVAPSLAERANLACNRLVKEVLDLPGLDEVEPLVGPAAQDLVGFRRLELLAAAGKGEEFKAALETWQKKFPQTTRLAAAQDLARKLFRGLPVNARSLGLLVPLSGPSAPFGQEVRQGAELALDQANAGLPEDQRFKLEAADEGGDSLAAQAAALKLIDQDKVVGLLGPVLSKAAQAVAPLAQSRRVPLFSPTAAQAGLTDGNPFFFRNCLTAEGQGALLAAHAISQGLTRCATLYPLTPYGQALAQGFAREVSRTGGALLAEVSYTAGTVDFKTQLLDLGGINPGIQKEEESRARTEQQQLVEMASSALGDYFLQWVRQHPQPPPPTPSKVSTQPTPTPGPSLEVAVVDFACDSAAAAYHSGRAMSDKFWRTLGHLDGVEVRGPGQSEGWLAQHPDQARGLTPDGAIALAASLKVPLLLAGAVAEVQPDFEALGNLAKLGGVQGAKARKDLEKYAKFQAFSVNARVLDGATGSVVASRQFEFTKLKPVTVNAGSLQALYLPCDARDLALIAPNLKFYDLKVQLLGPDTWYRPEVLRDAEEVEGARLTTGFWAEDPAEPVQAFNRAYRKRFASQPSVLAAQAYDAARMVLEVLKSAPNREDLRDGLEALRDFPGVTGKTTFNGRHDAEKALPVLQVKEGRFVKVAP